MKRFVIITWILLVAISGCTISESSTNAVPQQRALKKIVTQRKREFRKGGWRFLDTCQAPETILSSFYASLSDDRSELVGESRVYVSKKVGKQASLNSSRKKYILEARQCFKDGVGCTYGSPFDFIDAIDKIEDVYLDSLEIEIKACIEPGFWVYRPTGATNKEGKECLEFKVYCLLDEEKATEARLRAMEKALQQFEILQPYEKHFCDIATTRVICERF